MNGNLSNPKPFHKEVSAWRLSLTGNIEIPSGMFVHKGTPFVEQSAKEVGDFVLVHFISDHPTILADHYQVSISRPKGYV